MVLLLVEYIFWLLCHVSCSSSCMEVACCHVANSLASDLCWFPRHAASSCRSFNIFLLLEKITLDFIYIQMRATLSRFLFISTCVSFCVVSTAVHYSWHVLLTLNLSRKRRGLWLQRDTKNAKMFQGGERFF